MMEYAIALIGAGSMFAGAQVVPKCGGSYVEVLGIFMVLAGCTLIGFAAGSGSMKKE